MECLLPTVTINGPVFLSFSYDNSVTLDMLSGRSGVNYRRDGTSIHPTVQQFLTGTAMRFKLEGHFNPRNKFYGISNLAANGW